MTEQLDTSLISETILFPSHAKTTVVNPNKAHAEKLAICFNSWDKGDHWPGGFTGGVPFTADFVLENHFSRKYIGLFAVELEGGDGFAGYCNLAQHHDPDTIYLPLLGVNPDFHGRGVGKALLLQALKTTISEGKRRLDLYTWGGNTKAVPLYKKVGFFWHPGTSVLMTNFLPSVLSCPLLMPFFQTYDWYSSRVLDQLTQSEDRSDEGGQHIYRYLFQSPNGRDKVEAVVDREAKELSGFHLRLMDQNFSAQLTVTPNVGYKGLDKPKAYLLLENSGPTELKIDIQIIPREGVTIDPIGDNPLINQVLAIKQGESVGLVALMHYSDQLLTYDPVEYPDTRTDVRFQILLTINGKKILLGAGMRLVDPFHANAFPTQLLGTRDEVVVGVTNLLPRLFEGVAKVVVEDQILAKETVTIEPDGNWSFNLMVPEKYHGQTAVIPFEVWIGEGEKEVRLPVPVPLFARDKVLVYNHDRDWFVENKSFRAKIWFGRSMSCKELTLKDYNLSLNIGRSVLNVGPRYPQANSEFWNLPYEVEVEECPDGKRIKVTKVSHDELPGVTAITYYQLNTGDNFLSFWFELFSSERQYNGLQLRALTYGHWSPVTQGFGVFPLRQGLVKVTNFYNSLKELFPSEDFHQNWWAFNTDRFSYGSVWDSGYVKIKPSFDSWPVLETELFDLGSEGYQSPKVRLVMTPGTFEEVRKIYYQEVEYKSPPKNAPVITRELFKLQTASQVILSPDKPAVPSNYGSELVLSTLWVSGTSFDYQLLQGSELIAEGTLTVSRDDHVRISFWLDDQSIEFTSISLILNNGLYDELLRSLVAGHSKKLAKHTTERRQDQHIHVISNGLIKAEISPDFGGSMISLKYKEAELIWSRFPNSGPFIWFDWYVGGGVPLLRPTNHWMFKQALSVRYQVTLVEEQSWVGVKLVASPVWDRRLKGLEYSTTYWVHPCQPMVVVDLEVVNRSKGPKECQLEFHLAQDPSMGYQLPQKGQNLKTLTAAKMEYAQRQPKQRPWLISGQAEEPPFLGFYLGTEASEMEIVGEGIKMSAVEAIQRGMVLPNTKAHLRVILVASSELAVLEGMADMLYRYPEYIGQKSQPNQP